jgi:hypothetical protein
MLKITSGVALGIHKKDNGIHLLAPDLHFRQVAEFDEHLPGANRDGGLLRFA